jgi:hypothetical protein
MSNPPSVERPLVPEDPSKDQEELVLCHPKNIIYIK